MAPIFDARKLFHYDPAHAIIIHIKEPYMGMQNNFRLSKTKNNILYILSGASLALFASLMLFPTITESTHAEKQSVTSDGITITFSTDVVADVKTSRHDNYKIVKDTVSVSTDSWINWGFTVFVSADDSDIYLGGDASSASKISGIDGTYYSPKPLKTNTWGWAAPGVGRFDDAYSVDGPDGESKFAAMPTEDTIIRDYPSLFAAWDGKKDTDVYYGFKLDGDILESGEYITTVKYTAIPQNDNPLAAKAILGDNGNLNFVYDRKTYTSGDAYVDNLGETAIVSVTNVPKDRSCTSSSSRPWPNGVHSVNFDASFVNFKPTNTCRWFSNMLFEGSTSMTNHENFNTSQVTDMSYMFYQSNAATVFDLDLSNWDTSKVTDMSYMFGNTGLNNSIATYKLDLSGWDTGNVTDMEYMFLYAGSGDKVDTWKVSGLSSWNTENVTNMRSMFEGTGWRAATWTLEDLSGWNTSNVTNMQNMFRWAGLFTAGAWDIGNLDNWDTSNVTNMSSMFNQAGFIATTWNIGDISGWDVTKVTDHSNFIGLNSKESNASVVNNQPHWN